ncbi:MAG: choice-of-anchor tandem repeat GloVer-containing protein, partial [Terracidiphilus sp.]
MTDRRHKQVLRFRLAASGALTLNLLLLGIVMVPVAQAQFTFKNLYSFASKTVGWGPEAGLIQDSAGNFYGTTSNGGAHYSGPNGGIVFKVSPTGTETTLYNFCGSGTSCLDGSDPMSTLLMDSAGNLYGTLNSGGANNKGAVFELSPAPGGGSCPSGTYQGNGWCETVLYSFANGSDGAFPAGKLIQDSSGNLYSTTSYGTPNTCGTVFELTPPGSGSTPWTETTLYTFGGSGTGDACGPVAGLVFDGSGNLYGTAATGGTNNDGAVYELSPSGGTWTETFLYSFTGGLDGCDPQSDLAYVGGNLYGTT